MRDIRDYAQRNANWYCTVVYRQDGSGEGSKEGRKEGQMTRRKEKWVRERRQKRKEERIKRLNEGHDYRRKEGKYKKWMCILLLKMDVCVERKHIGKKEGNIIIWI